MAKQKNRSDGGDWRSRLITLVLEQRDLDILTELKKEHHSADLVDIVVSLMIDGHGLKLKYSQYYGCWVISVTFGEYIPHLSGYTVLTYVKELDSLVAYLKYLFGYLVENDDPRLRHGGMTIGDW